MQTETVDQVEPLYLYRLLVGALHWRRVGRGRRRLLVRWRHLVGDDHTGQHAVLVHHLLDVLAWRSRHGHRSRRPVVRHPLVDGRT